MRRLSMDVLVYTVIIASTLAGIVGNLFRSYDFNPFGIPMAVLAGLLFLCIPLGYRFGKCALFGGWLSVLSGSAGFIGLTSIAVIWGVMALIFAGVTMGHITLTWSR